MGTLMWQIRKARFEELDSLMPVYERARNFMRQTGNTAQWINGYPSHEVLAADIEAGHLYVCEEITSGILLAVFAFVPGPDPTYSRIEDGVWPDSEPYYVIHRIASTGHRKGVARFCFDWCLSRHPVLRIDTHADNKPMLNLLEKEGFARCGIIYVADGSPRTAFQKNKRCGWCGTDQLYVKYHDEEWGKYMADERRLFEFLILESAQAGLSWITILHKREAYRKAFYNFDVAKVAQMTAADVECLMQNEGIVRNRLKIESTIINARCFLKVAKEFGTFDAYVRTFLPKGKLIDNRPQKPEDIPASSSVSDAMSKDMRRRGFKFFGTTICYAFLQATGYINDHLTGCSYR